MVDVIISMESTCDLNEELIKKYDFRILDMNFIVDDVEYSTICDSVESTNLYQKMKEGKKVSTYQVPPEVYREYFSKLLEENKPVIHLAFSSGLSGMCHNAIKVAEEMNKQNKNKVFVIDSLCGCGGQGLYGILIKNKANEASKITEILDYAVKTKLNVNHVFTVDTLKYLLNGGRIRFSKYVFSEIFNIKPFMQVDADGKLFVAKKIVTRRKTIDAMFNKFQDERDKSSNLVIISGADCKDDVEYLASQIRNKLNIEPIITDLGPIIGSHSGPGTLSFYYLGKTRCKYY
ncbi:DegV family protein [bacterium]|nr:DegV family protein [bacterium]